MLADEDGCDDGEAPVSLGDVPTEPLVLPSPVSPAMPWFFFFWVSCDSLPGRNALLIAAENRQHGCVGVARGFAVQDAAVG